MSNSTTPTEILDRYHDESELEWKDRLKEYIEETAPVEHRFYSRGGKLGASWQRWIFPGIVFGTISLCFIILGYINNADIRNLKSSNGTTGEFIVEKLQRSPRYGVLEENQPLVPVVSVRGESIVPLYSHDKGFEVGKPVTLKYTQQGKVVASFLDDKDNIPSMSYIMTILSGLLFAGIGVLVGRANNGTVDPKYEEEELARLMAKSK